MARRYPRVKLPTRSPSDPPMSAKPRAGGRYDWVGARKTLEDNPGVWLLMFNEPVSTGTYSHASRGKLVAFHGLGGYLESRLIDQEKVGTITEGSLWMRWEPEGWTEEDQARANAAAQAGEGQL